MEERVPDSKLESWGNVFALTALGIVLSLIALVVAFVVFSMVLASALGSS